MKTFFTLRGKIGIGLGIGLLVVLLSFEILPITFIQNLNLYAIDFGFQRRSVSADLNQKDVVIVEISDEDLEALHEKFPFPRNYYARAIESLNQAGARVIGFDMTFQDSRSGDDSLKLILQRYSNIVLAAYESIDKNLGSLNIFYDGTKHIGIVNFLKDRDGVCRRYAPFFYSRDNITPSFAFAIVACARGLPPLTRPKIVDGEIFFEQRRIPVFKENGFLLNFYGPVHTFSYIPFSKVFDREIARIVQDKIVLIGSTMAGDYDYLSVPVKDVHSTIPKQTNAMYGVEIHATAIKNILDQNFIKRPPLYLEQLVVLIFAVMAFLSILTIKKLKFRFVLLKNILALAVMVIIIYGIVQASIFIFAAKNVLVNFANSSISVVAAYIGALVYQNRIKQYLQEEERKRLIGELRAARDMQMGLMPKEDPVVAGFDISGVCLPAKEVGGDFYDYVWMDEKKTKLGIAVADVSGKAMKAAITAVMTSGMVYREVGGNESPKSILQKINKPTYAKLDRGMFTAMLFAVIDTKRKALAFSNAGQMRPILKRDDKTQYIRVDGLPLGIKEEATYRETKIKLKKGDLVVFYTDGITEAMNEQKEQYGEERLERLVKSLGIVSAREVRDGILADVQAFTGNAEQHDDMTVVVLRVV